MEFRPSSLRTFGVLFGIIRCVINASSDLPAIRIELRITEGVRDLSALEYFKASRMTMYYRKTN